MTPPATYLPLAWRPARGLFLVRPSTWTGRRNAERFHSAWCPACTFGNPRVILDRPLLLGTFSDLESDSILGEDLILSEEPIISLTRSLRFGYPPIEPD